VSNNTETETDLAGILNAREKRFLRQRELLRIYKTSLISFTLNIPGAQKQSEAIRQLHRAGIELLCQYFPSGKILFRESIHGDTGSEGFLCIDEEACRVKHKTIFVEETHPAGRLFDMDVFDTSGAVISRNTLGLPARKCFICDSEANVCKRLGRHSMEVLRETVQQLLSPES
jgi:holo-ACP synthase